MFFANGVDSECFYAMFCRRNFCKYRHITKEEEDAEILGLLQSSAVNRQRLEQSQNGVSINVNEAQATQLMASKGGLFGNVFYFI